MTEREEFEQFFLRDICASPNFSYSEEENTYFADDEVEVAWWAWQTGRALLSQESEPSAKNADEPVIIEEPEYHYEGMGCGLEDLGITDRYEAMRHGWDCAIERVFEQIPEGQLFVRSLPKESAEKTIMTLDEFFDEATRIGLTADVFVKQLKCRPEFADCFPTVEPEIVNQLSTKSEPCRDWTEDFTHENGEYFNRCYYCKQEFTGHKRRIVCKECATKSEPSNDHIADGKKEEE